MMAAKGGVSMGEDERSVTPTTGLSHDSRLARDGLGPRLPPYAYREKNRWSIKLNFLSGITLLPWLTLLLRHWRSIDWLVYPHRILFLFFMAVFNTMLSIFDWLFFSSAVAAQPLHPEPVFILGHPRTGTTHLHNLLSTDPRFAFATTFHAGFPSSFLSLEPARSLLSGLLERRRPMDHMALDWDLPAEDEIAVNVLTGGDSPYMALVLPRLWRPLLRRYLTWGPAAAEGAAAGAAPAHAVVTEPGSIGGSKVAAAGCSARQSVAGLEAVTPAGARGDGNAGSREEASGTRGESGGDTDPGATEAFGRWLAAFTWFMKKVTYRHVRRCRGSASTTSAASSSGAGNVPPPLLIKSPVHTARLGVWRRLFPRARYIFVHRHPLEVFQSAANMADTYYWYTYLQRPTDDVTNDFITDQYDLLYRSYLSERRHIPPDQLVEVAFSDLDSDPLAVLHSIYKHFGWEEHLSASEPRFRLYLQGLEDFKKNHFNKLSPEAEVVLRERWRESFEAFGYK